MARVLITNPPDAPGPVLDIALSERNLLTLLSKLYTPGSACSFLSGDIPDELGFAHPCLRAEPDEYHYGSPPRGGAPAGSMHPLTERVLIAVRAAVAEFLGDTDLQGWRPRTRRAACSWHPPFEEQPPEVRTVCGPVA